MWTLEVHADEDSASGGDNQSGNQPVWVGRRWTKEAKVGWRLRNGGGHVGLNAHSTRRLSSLSLEFALPPSLSPPSPSFLPLSSFPSSYAPKVSR